jgi:monoamine oxidase
MKRKEFVRNMLAVAPLAFFPSVLLSGCKKDNVKSNGKKVVIVGAGLAGLAAGVKLEQNGFEVILLEGRDRSGGRIRTDRSGGVVFDEGASWIHGPTNNPMKGLAADAGGDTYLTDDDSLRIYDSGGTLIPESVADPAYSDYEDAVKAVVNAGSQNQDFATVFDGLYPGRSSTELWKYMLSAYLEFDTGGDIGRLSSLYVEDDEAFGGKDRILTNGYDTLTDYLARDLDIRLNETVSNINYSAETATVTSNLGEYEADFVLVTVPLGVLQAGDITFSPALPGTKIGALGELEMGNVNKFLLTWAVPFWDTSIQYVGFTAAEKGKFNYFLNFRTFSSSNSLMTFAFGDYGLQTESMTDQQVQDEVMTHLRTIYGSNTPDPSSLRRTKWQADPFAKGAYSFVANGGRSEAYDILAGELNGNLFFAGEHTSRDYRGTAHGAFLSGEREADKIIDLV